MRRVVCLDEGEGVVGETTGEPGQRRAVAFAPVGEGIVAAGRNQSILDRLAAGGADAVVRVDRPHDELAAAIAAEGPYDLIVDYLWGAPAEAVFAALQLGRQSGEAPRRSRYIQAGMTAGDVASLPAMALRSAPIQLFGSGSGRPVSLAETAAANESLLQQVVSGEIVVDVEAVPLAHVEKAWQQSGSDRRIVFVP